MSPEDTHDAASASEARRGLKAADRIPLYLFGLTLLVIIAFVAGITQFEATECSGPEEGECDMAAFGGVFWAACAFVLGLVAVAVSEILVARRRRAARRTARVTSGQG